MAKQRQKLKPHQIEYNDKVGLALSLRLEGKSLAEIARECGWNSVQATSKAIKSAMDRTIREPADELRELWAMRIEAALAPLWRRIEKGDTAAIDRLIKLCDRFAKLYGLDAPSKTAITDAQGKDIQLPAEEAAQRVAALLAAAQERRAQAEAPTQVEDLTADEVVND